MRDFDEELSVITPRKKREVTLCDAGGRAINLVTGECACCSD